MLCVFVSRGGWGNKEEEKRSTTSDMSYHRISLYRVFFLPLPKSNKKKKLDETMSDTF